MKQFLLVSIPLTIIPLTMIPDRHPSAIHIGTGEFAFCAGARTPAEARPPRGFRDLGNVEVYKFETNVERFDREGVYRGRRIIDASFVISRGFNYVFRCDETTKDNLKLLALGTDAGTNARSALVNQACDAMPFTPLQPTAQDVWYDILLNGVEVTHLTAVRLSTLSAVDLSDEIHYVTDLNVGRVRFLVQVEETLVVHVDAAAITSADRAYMEAVTPLQTTALRGIGRFLQFRALDESLNFDHRGFTCLLSTAGLTEQSAKAPSTFDLGVRITHDRGQVWVRAQAEAFPPFAGDTEPPDAPSSLTATAVSSSAINLEWTDNSDNESGFKIERKTGMDSFAEIDTVAAGITTYADPGLDASTEYVYRVRATNSNGDSDYSNEASDTTAPAAPSSLTATTSTSSEIDLAWTDNSSNEDGFKIERKTGAGGTYAEIDTVGAGVEAHTDTGLDPETEYFYRVRAFNDDGDSPYSNEDSATTDAEGPTLPAGLLLWYDANAITGLSDTDPIATWPDESGNGNDATQSTAADKPLYRTNQINGLPAVEFDGTSDYFSVAGLFGGSETAAEMFIVVKLDADPPATTTKTGSWNLAGNGGVTSFPRTAGDIRDSFCSTALKVVGNPTPSLTAWRLYNAASAAGDWKARLDGTQIFSTATNTFTITALGPGLSLGRWFSTSFSYLDGMIAEVLVFDHVLSAGDRDVVEAYIADKYALTIA